MTNYATGHAAEKVAAVYLRQNGFKILDINWRTKYCEIDIVAHKKKRVYFVEVKHRNVDFAGSGFEYITPKKLNQMKFAAEMWVAHNQWKHDYQLAAIEVGGQEFEIINFLDEV